MYLFEVVAVDSDATPALPVFADSYGMAVNLYMIWWTHRGESDLPGIEVKMRNTEWPGLDTQRLVKALELGMSGIGRLDPVHGWLITPADQVEEEE